MKAAVFALLLVLGSPAVLGRKLLQDGCADFSVLAGMPEVSDIVTLINGFGLLPGGVPANVTLFLPNNDAVEELIGMVRPIVPTITVENLPQTVASLPATLGVTERLVSALLYHIAPIGAQEPEALLDAGTIPTALEGFPLEFEEAGPGNYTLTTAIDEVANTSDPVLACGSAVYVIDRVMTPAGLLDPSFPLTTLEEALLILGVEQAAPAPAAP